MIKSKKVKRSEATKVLMGFSCLGVLIALAMSDCFYKENDSKETNKFEVKQEIAPKEQINVKQKDLDLTYNYVCQFYSGFSKYLNYGLYDGNPCVKIGHGVPITVEELKALPYDNNHYDMTGFVANVQQHYDNVLNGKGKDSVLFPDDVIRVHVKNFLKQREAYYASLCEEHGFSYKEVPNRARAGFFAVDSATGFKKGPKKGIASYNKFLEAVKNQDWIKAGEEAAVSDRIFKENNPNVYEDATRIFNINMKQLFGELEKEKQKYIEVQNHLKQHGKSL